MSEVEIIIFKLCKNSCVSNKSKIYISTNKQIQMNIWGKMQLFKNRFCALSNKLGNLTNAESEQFKICTESWPVIWPVFLLSHFVSHFY